MLRRFRGLRGPARAPQQDGEQGQILVLFTLAIMFVLLGFAAIVIDAGLLRTDSARLQNALDAGALAAAQSLPADNTNVTAVRTTATAFTQNNFPGIAAPNTTFACLIGNDGSDLPRITDMPAICNVYNRVSDPTGTRNNPNWRCTGLVCWAPCDPAANPTDVCNTVILRDSATRNYTFGRAIGVNSGSTGTLVSAACTGACGGPPLTPVDVVLTIDRTGSMRNLESLLVGGAHAVLTAYDPEIQHVALGLIGPSSQLTPCSTGAYGRILENGTLTSPAYQSDSSGSNASSGATTLSISRPSGTGAGEFLVAAITFDGGSTLTSISAPADWQLIDRVNNGTNVGQATYYKVATGSEPSSYQWTFSSSKRASGGIILFADVDTSDPINRSSRRTGTGTTLTADGVTTTTARTTLVGFFTSDANTAISPSGTGSLTEQFDVTNSNSSGPRTEGSTRAQAATGATGDKTATGANAAWVTQLIALNPVPVESYPTGYPTTNPPYTEAFISANMEKWIPVGLTGTSDGAKVNESYLNADGSVRAASEIAKAIGCVLPPNSLYNGTDQASPFDFAWRYLRDNARHDPKTGERVKTGIIFETDGTPQLQNYTCAQAQKAASDAKADGIDVFVIGFFASNDPGDPCPDSSGAWRGKTIVQSLAAMATDSTTTRTNACDADENTDGDHFFCTPDPAMLDDVFRAAAVALSSGSRLVQMYPQPEVTGVSPNSGPIAGGTSVTITGKYFTEAYSVTFGGADARSFTVLSDTSIRAVSPDHGAGAVDIQVSTPGGSSKIVSADRFTFTAP